jgi:hypothetical protein
MDGDCISAPPPDGGAWPLADRCVQRAKIVARNLPEIH